MSLVPSRPCLILLAVTATIPCSSILAGAEDAFGRHSSDLDLDIMAPLQHETGDLRDEGVVHALAFSENGLLVAGGTSMGKEVIRAAGEIVSVRRPGGEVVLWDASSGELTRILGKHDGDVEWLAFSENADILVSISEHGQAKVWNLQIEEQRGEFKVDECADFRLAPDGRSLVGAVKVDQHDSGRKDVKNPPRLIVWDVQTGEERWSVPKLTSAMAVSPDSRHLLAFASPAARLLEGNDRRGVSAGTAQLCRWQLASGTLEWCSDPIGLEKQSMAFRPGSGAVVTLMFGDEPDDGPRLSAESPSFRMRRLIPYLVSWDAETGEKLSRAEVQAVAGSNPPDRIRVSGDGSTAVLFGHQRSLAVWDLRAGRPRGVLRDRVMYPTFPRSLEKLACRTSDRTRSIPVVALLSKCTGQ